MDTGQPDFAALVIRQAALQLLAKTDSCSNIQDIRQASSRKGSKCSDDKRPEVMSITQNTSACNNNTST